MESVELTPSTGRRILVVDDEPAILKALVTILSRQKYEVEACPSAAVALEALKKYPFDCIISDVLMPDVDGFAFAKMVRADPLYQSIPILMLTRKRNREDVKAALLAGATDYIIKPVDEFLLLDKIVLCMKKGDGKRHLPECQVSDELVDAHLTFHCAIDTLSETEITVRTPFMIPQEHAYGIIGPLFDKLGIKPPMIKLISCEAMTNSIDTRPLHFLAKFNLLGISETDLAKIRTWLHREEIRRRK